MNTLNQLPQTRGQVMVTDGGLETDLIFHHGLDLPHFASYPLLADQRGRALLTEYYGRYAAIAADTGAGLVLEAPTWRSSPDWAERIGHTPEEMDQFNRDAISFLSGLRRSYADTVQTIVISGCVGPRGDGYVADDGFGADEAQEYHSRQIRVFAEAGADQVTAMTITNVDEAIGITRAAQAAGIPVAISFTVETDGRLPSGQPLGSAITETDRATGDVPMYYMINCAHPTHFTDALAAGETWTERIGGLRANASVMSHEELDEATDLDDGDPVDLGSRHADLRSALPNLTVLGGCCGTDHRHVGEIARAWTAAAVGATA